MLPRFDWFVQFVSILTFLMAAYFMWSCVDSVWMLELNVCVSFFNNHYNGIEEFQLQICDDIKLAVHDLMNLGSRGVIIVGNI